MCLNEELEAAIMTVWSLNYNMIIQIYFVFPATKHHVLSLFPVFFIFSLVYLSMIL